MMLNVKIQELPIDRIVENVGQIPEVPANPRRITDEAFELLKKSIDESARKEFYKLIYMQ